MLLPQRVEVAVGDRTYRAKVSEGQWEVPNLKLDPGLNYLRVSFAGSEATRILFSVAGMTTEKQQVRFKWDGVDSLLEDIAVATLTAELTAEQREAFVLGVKAHCQLAFFRALEGFVLGTASGDGPAVHTLAFKSDGRGFGMTNQVDCGNHELSGTSSIHLRKFYWEWKNLRLWKPMNAHDSLLERIQDVGEALGRTAAHEFVHGLGLVRYDAPDEPCSWLRSCLGHHNRLSAADADDPQCVRTGNYLMNEGADRHFRIGESSTEERSLFRTSPLIRSQNRKYLSVVLEVAEG